MAKEIILDKLSRELAKENPDECRLVYVLSRIRKYLEVTDSREEYKYLNFYCNWALHTRIDNTKAMEEVLKDLLGQNDRHGFYHCGPFLKDFGRFLEDKSLPRNWITGSDNVLNLIHLLLEVYSDTPVYFFGEKRFKLSVNRPKPITELPEGCDYLMAVDIVPAD